MTKASELDDYRVPFFVPERAGASAPEGETPTARKGRKALIKAEKKAEVKVNGHIVLLCSGFHKRHYPNIEAVTMNPQLTVEATKWLHERGSKMHGVEGPSTDKPSDGIFAQHRLCRELGMSHWEWLVNLEELVGKGEFQFYGVPLKFKGGSGSPVRAFAVLNA